MIREILDHYTGVTKKSSALQPLVLPIITLSVSAVAVAQADPPNDILFFFTISLLVLVGTFSLGFITLLYTNADALRSETFNPAKARDELGKTDPPP